MSGSPKYSQAALDLQRQAKLAEERKRKAKEEAKQRREAEERERQERLAQLCNQIKQSVQDLVQMLHQHAHLMYAEDVVRLNRQCQQHLKAISEAEQESTLRRISRILNDIETDMQQAITRKRRDDEEKKRKAELEKQQFDVEELQRQLGQISRMDAQKFDATGQQQSQQDLQTAQQALTIGDPARVRRPLQMATTSVQQHCDLVRQHRAEWQRRKAEAEQAQGELATIVAGLAADPVVVCWQSDVLAELRFQNQVALRALKAEQFDSLAALLAQVKVQSQVMISAGNAAQIKADQRDYIASSIAETLQDMGFSILYRQPEHPDHPASAIVLGAATNSGKGISISVPVEGEVFYDVKGYAKSTAAAVGGGTAAVCDEAEQVITEMHQALAEQFGIGMSELQWEGKDPNRQIRKADELPAGGQTRYRAL